MPVVQAGHRIVRADIAELILHPFALGDFLGDADHGAHLVLFVKDGLGRCDVISIAVFPRHPHFDHPHLASLEHPSDNRESFIGFLLRENIPDLETDDLIQFSANTIRKRLVDIAVGAILTKHKDRIAGLIQKDTISFFPLPENLK